MNPHRFSLSLLLLTLSALLANGCFGGNLSKDKLIEEIIKAEVADRDTVLEDASFSDLKVYRDGDKDGVVLEYYFSESADIDRSQLAAPIVKSNLVNEFRENRMFKRQLGMGIYYRFVYKTSDGEELADVKLTDDDF